MSHWLKVNYNLNCNAIVLFSTKCLSENIIIYNTRCPFIINSWLWCHKDAGITKLPFPTASYLLTIRWLGKLTVLSHSSAGTGDYWHINEMCKAGARSGEQKHSWRTRKGSWISRHFNNAKMVFCSWSTSQFDKVCSEWNVAAHFWCEFDSGSNLVFI